MAGKKSICVSRSFNGMVADPKVLKTHVANYAARAAEKLRKQRSVASVLGVFIATNSFREDLEQHSAFTEHRFLSSTDSTLELVKAAESCVEEIFRPGCQYKRAGVILMSIENADGIQTNFIDFDAERFQRMKRLDQVVDRINRVNGRETVILGIQQYPGKAASGKAPAFEDVVKRDFKSPCYPTRWSEIIELS